MRPAAPYIRSLRSAWPSLATVTPDPFLLRRTALLLCGSRSVDGDGRPESQWRSEPRIVASASSIAAARPPGFGAFSTATPHSPHIAAHTSPAEPGYHLNWLSRPRQAPGALLP